MIQRIALVAALVCTSSIYAASQTQTVPPEVVRVQAKTRTPAPASAPILHNGRVVAPLSSTHFSSTTSFGQVAAKPLPISPRLRSTVFPGSLKANIQRMAKHYGWPLIVWNSQNDYNWTGRTRITAGSFPGLLSQMLRNYPLQAVFYKGNHVLVIGPRTLK